MRLREIQAGIVPIERLTGSDGLRIHLRSEAIVHNDDESDVRQNPAHSLLNVSPGGILSMRLFGQPSGCCECFVD